MTGWRIFTGGEAEIPSVLALWRVAETLPSTTDTVEALRCLLGRDPRSLFLARANDEVVGSLIVGWDGWRGSFYRLAVHPQWRRQGVATALIRAGEERLQSLGAVRLTAVVASEERIAVDLWTAAGYERQISSGRFVRMLAD